MDLLLSASLANTVQEEQIEILAREPHEYMQPRDRLHQDCMVCGEGVMHYLHLNWKQWKPLSERES